MQNIAARIEELACEGFSEGETLTILERAEIVAFTFHFEECDDSREVLASLSDKDLIDKSYRVMAEYASGQI